MLNEGSDATDIAAYLGIIKRRYHKAAEHAIFEAIHFLRMHQYRFVANSANDLQKARQQCELAQSSMAATDMDTTSTSALSTEANLGNGNQEADQEASTASETAQL